MPDCREPAQCHSSPPATLRDYDVIVVGSGAAGGQTAYTLSMSGARVLMLEAGRNYVPEHETPMFQTRGEAPAGAAHRRPTSHSGFTMQPSTGLAGAGRTLREYHAGGLGTLRLVARSNARRTHQPLGALFLPQRSLRLRRAAATGWDSTGR